MRPSLLLILLIISTTTSCLGYSTDFGLLISIKSGEENCLVNQQPKGLQCTYVTQNCGTEGSEAGKINYLKLYYCDSRWFWGSGSLVLLVFMIACFIAIGNTASDYLCPNLYTLSKALNFSDNVAGLTLLALGNVSPDVLSTYKAMEQGSGSLAISEILGSAFFVVSFVLGSVAIVHPFTVPANSFWRDIIFTLCVIGVVLSCLILASLNVATCILLVLAYVAYVLFVLVVHSLYKLKVKRRLREERSRSHYRNEVQVPSTDDISLDDFGHLPTIDDMNLHDPENIHEQEFDEYSDYVDDSNMASLAVGSYALKRLLKELGEHANGSAIHLGESFERPLTAPVPKTDHFEVEEEHYLNTFPRLSRYDRSLSDFLTENSEEILQPEESTVQDLDDNSTFHSLKLMLQKVGWRAPFHLLLPHFREFKEASILNKIRVIISMPLVILLRSTTPVKEISNDSTFENHLDIEDSLVKLNFDLVLVFQIFFGINVISLTMGKSFILGFIVSVASALCLRALQYFNVLSRKNLTYLYAFLGFLISLFWVATFATEIVFLLKAITIIYGISDEIVGMTIFALGNSTADFISNYTISKMGMPLMAFGACFGGPLLALCSLGFSGLVIITKTYSQDQEYFFEISASLFIVTIGLVLSLVIISVMVPKNKWVIDKKIGIVLIFNWIVTIITCIIVNYIS